MRVTFVGEDKWLREDRRPYAALSIEIEYFERMLNTLATNYIEDGLGSAKGFMCKIGETQFYIWSLEAMEPKYETTIDFPYPFLETDKLLKEVVKEFGLQLDKVSWVTKET